MRHLVVFDLDGVLADVSLSYRDTVRETAHLFFRFAPRWEELPWPLFSLADLARLKQSGGLNNDWDLSCLVIELLMSRVDAGPAGLEPRGGNGCDPWALLAQRMSRCDLAPLAAFLRDSPRPLSDLLRLEGRRQDPFVRRLYRNDVGSGNLIKQIFQEVYLGEELFTRTYGFPPRLHSGSGYIERERLLASPELLRELAGRHVLAIATGRPAEEARYFLSRYRLSSCFRKVVTLDDCLAEQKRILSREGRTVSLSKPHPFMLDAIAAELAEGVCGRYYVGDMPDDMEAARRSGYGYLGIGLLQASPEGAALRAGLLRAGAEQVVEDFAALAGLLSRRADC